MNIKRNINQLKDGRTCESIILKNNSDAYVEILTLGAIVKGIYVPDKNGVLENIVLEYKDTDSYIDNPIALNAIIGRTAGRIHKGQVTIDGVQHQLATNQMGNTLHGGYVGLHKKVWDVAEVSELPLSVVLTSKLEDGEEGYPGEVGIKVVYTFTEDNTLTVSYEAESTKDTVINLTNHAYFNLAGNSKTNIEQHILQVKADKLCELDEESIPTGKFLEVREHTEFDFNTPKVVGEDIDKSHEQLQLARGYDHPWVISEQEEVVTLSDPTSGRSMTVTTDQEAVVIYTMNWECDKVFTNGLEDIRRYGICFETQALPIGYGEVYKEGSLIKKGEIYRQHTSFKFSYK